MRKRTSDYSSDTEPQQPRDIDIALRCPLTAPATFLDAKIAFDNGGDEVRRFLVQECSLIFECNVCRSMFRDLKNFISHKRFYCCVPSPTAPCNGNGGGGSNSNSTSNGFPDPKSSTLIAATAALAVNAVHNGRFSSSSSVESADVGVADVLYDEQQQTVERQVELVHGLDEGQATSRPVEDVALDGNNAADKSAESKIASVEMDDVHSLITKMENILTQSQCEQKPSSDDAQMECMPQQPTVHVGKIKHPCGMCKMEFQTEKSLKIHMQKKHMASAHTFKCPSCALTFMQPTAVIRHLATDHKKSVRRIRMTRDTKRRLHSEESQLRGTANRELRRLQSTDSNVHEAESAEKKKVMSNCIYCEKSFERRAALSTHLMSCRVKLEALEKPTPIKRSKLQSSQLLEQHIHEAEIQPVADDIILDNTSLEQNTLLERSEEEAREEEEDEEEGQQQEQQQQQPINTTEEQFIVIKKEFNADESKETFESELSTVINNKVEESLEALDKSSDILAKQEEPLQEAIESINQDQAENDEQSVNKSDELYKGDTSESESATTKNKGKELSCRCKICNKQFNALSNLRRHISMFHYRARKFGCTLCDYRAFRRYDIVNHLGFVHKMTEDREMLATDYVSVHEVHYSKDDMDGDIVVLSEEQHKEVISQSAGEVVVVKTHEKRSKRTRTSHLKGHSNLFSSSKGADGEGKPTRPKLRRAASSSHANKHDVTGSSSATKSQKRPIRNRIKPENKDFVYDLSTLLKEENAAGGTSGEIIATEAGGGGGTELRSLKRRHTVYNAASGDFDGAARKPLTPLIGSGCRELVKSSTRRICLLMVSQGRAKLATQPELPAERPLMRPRLTSTCRMDMQAVPVIETSDLEAARRKSTLLEDSFLEKISRRSASEFKIKPCLELEHTALDTLLQKVDSSLQQQQLQLQLQQQQQLLLTNMHSSAAISAPCEANNTLQQQQQHQQHISDFQGLTNAATVTTALTSPPLANCAITQPNGFSCVTDMDKQYFISPLPSIPVASSPPSTPRKRITLVQRMADNKAAKQRESLLRSALEN